jgi:hypothetical protein
MRSSHDSKSSDSAFQEAERKGLLPERPSLTKKQIEFLHIYTASPFLPLKEICRAARVQPSQVAKWKKNSPGFKVALATEHRRSQVVANMDRKTVMRGLLEAVEMAKDMRQPGGMISGWKEVGRMCGFYEPEKREIMLSVNGQQLIEEMKTLPREELLRLAAEHKKPIEADFEVVDKG